MRWVLAMIIGQWPLGLVAEGLPQSVVVQVERNPDKYLDNLAVMIAGYGTDGAINAAALRNVVLMARAEARATALNRLQGADLDGDGAIAGPEMRVSAASASARARGQLVLNFAKADADGDDLVTEVELRAFANAAAQKAFSEDKEAAVYAILGFDTDGDGLVTLPEVKAAIATVALVGRADADAKRRIEGETRGGNQVRRNTSAQGGTGTPL